MIDFWELVPKETKEKFTESSESAIREYEAQIKDAIQIFEEKRKMAAKTYKEAADRARLNVLDVWKATFKDQEICQMPGVSVRIKHCLMNDSDDARPMLSDLAIKYTERELLKIPNFGRRCLWEARELMHSRGLSIGIFHEKNWHNE